MAVRPAAETNNALIEARKPKPTIVEETIEPLQTASTQISDPIMVVASPDIPIPQPAIEPPLTRDIEPLVVQNPYVGGGSAPVMVTENWDTDPVLDRQNLVAAITDLETQLREIREASGDVVGVELARLQPITQMPTFKALAPAITSDAPFAADLTIPKPKPAETVIIEEAKTALIRCAPGMDMIMAPTHMERETAIEEVPGEVSLLRTEEPLNRDAFCAGVVAAHSVAKPVTRVASADWIMPTPQTNLKQSIEVRAGDIVLSLPTDMSAEKIAEIVNRIRSLD
jgi:translation initiation factor IF-1